MSSTDDDLRFMAIALRLAARGLGRTWPNPAVGCVVVRDGRIIGRGWTQPGGRPHAEVEALRRAGHAALGATAYVTLEPCAHYGSTPPCTMAILRAGIRRVVVATGDPDPRVDGRGLDQLRQAGVVVDTGVCAKEAESQNRGFVLKIRERRPLVTLKLAISLDSRIATRTGQSQWITGDEARRHAHGLRASHDAILIGSGTALADDPDLTCRLPGLENRSPVRIVLDRRLRLLPASRLAQSAQTTPVWLMTAEPAPEGAAALEALGVEVLTTAAHSESCGLRTVLNALAERGITRLLIEGGRTVAASFLRARLVDRLIVYQAPVLIGEDGLAGVGAIGVEALDTAIRLGTGTPRETGTALASDRVQVYTVLDT